jgi:hypothetical protein
MAYKAKWYTDEGNLRSIGREHLNKLLDRYKRDLAACGIEIEEPDDDDTFYRRLVEVFMRPDGIPPTLHEALFFIEELNNARSEERLVKAAQDGRITVSFNGECSTADKALLAWLADEEAVRQLHVEVGLDASRSFLHMPSKKGARTRLKDFAAAKPHLEADLAVVFQNQSREAWAEVTYHPRGHEHVFLVKRTEPYRRETQHVPSGTQPLYFWPTSQDIVVYDADLCDLRLNVTSKWQKEAYAQIFGQYMFGDPYTFFEGAKYTLRPLRDQGPACLEASAHGISSITLHELSCKVKEDANDYRIRRADDVFKVYADEGGLPEGEELAAAKFRVKFADSSTERMVTVQPPNRAKYMQDDNGARVTAWMKEQGFILSSGPEAPPTVTGSVNIEPPKQIVQVTLTC